MEAATLSEARVYVGTYGKYNNGSLFGAWLDLSDYSDKEDFYEACRELHKDEEDAEYMFQDWENVPENLIGESWISENFFTLRDAVECGGKVGRHRTGSLFRVVQLQKP